VAEPGPGIRGGGSELGDRHSARGRGAKDKVFSIRRKRGVGGTKQTGEQSGARTSAASRNNGTGTGTTVYRESATRIVKTLRNRFRHRPGDGRIPALTPAVAGQAPPGRRDEERGECADTEASGFSVWRFLTAAPRCCRIPITGNIRFVQDQGCVRRASRDDPRRQIISLDGSSASAVRHRLWRGDSVAAGRRHARGDTTKRPRTAAVSTATAAATSDGTG